MNRKPTVDSLVFWWNTLTGKERSAFPDSHVALKAILARRAQEIAANTFVTCLSDAKAIQLLVQRKGYAPELAEAMVKSWRKYGSDMGYNGPVAWKVRQGFTLKTHAPLAGPCHNKLDDVQKWSFTDIPTTYSLVFWVPRLAEQSTNKTIQQMEAHRAEQRQAHNLPVNYCDSFGSIGLLFALILAHFKRTGERVPLSCLYAASNAPASGGYHLVAGYFGSTGPRCDYWDGQPRSNFGFFLLGVEELG